MPKDFKKPKELVKNNELYQDIQKEETQASSQAEQVTKKNPVEKALESVEKSMNAGVKSQEAQLAIGDIKAGLDELKDKELSSKEQKVAIKKITSEALKPIKESVLNNSLASSGLQSKQSGKESIPKEDLKILKTIKKEIAPSKMQRLEKAVKNLMSKVGSKTSNARSSSSKRAVEAKKPEGRSM